MKPLLRQFTVESNDAEPPRRALHRIILLFVAAFAIGGGIYAVHDYMAQQEAMRVSAARTEMIKAQAKANKLTLLSEDTIKELTAINTGVPLNELTFKETALITFDDLPFPPGPPIGQGMMPNDKNADSSTNKPMNGQAADSSDSHENLNLPATAENSNVASLPPLRVPPPIAAAGPKPPLESERTLIKPNESNTDREHPPIDELAKGVQINDFTRTPPKELLKHPLYKITAKRSSLTYDLIIDGVNGHIIKSIFH